MNALHIPFKVIVTVLVTLLLIGIGMRNLRDRVAWIDPWDGVFWVEGGQGLRAQEVAEGGPGAEAGVQPGELLLAINGREVANLGLYFGAIDSLGVNAIATYRIAGPSGTREIAVTLAGKGMISARDVPRTLLAFLHLGIGLFVVLRGSRQPRAVHFYLISIAAFVVYLYSYTPRLSTFDWTVFGLSVSAFLVLPALFVHFCMRFPSDTAKGTAGTFLIYAPAAVLMLALFFSYRHGLPMLV